MSELPVLPPFGHQVDIPAHPVAVAYSITRLFPDLAAARQKLQVERSLDLPWDMVDEALRLLRNLGRARRYGPSFPTHALDSAERIWMSCMTECDQVVIAAERCAARHLIVSLERVPSEWFGIKEAHVESRQ